MGIGVDGTNVCLDLGVKSQRAAPLILHFKVCFQVLQVNITHPNLQASCWWLSCIVRNVKWNKINDTSSSTSICIFFFSFKRSISSPTALVGSRRQIIGVLFNVS